MPRASANKPTPEAEVLEGQTAIDDDKKNEEPAPTTQAQTVLWSKGDVAEKFGMTTQALANRATRDPSFPRPTYTNKNGTVELFTAEDVRRVGEYLLKPSEEQRARILASLQDL